MLIMTGHAEEHGSTAGEGQAEALDAAMASKRAGSGSLDERPNPMRCGLVCGICVADPLVFCREDSMPFPVAPPC